MMTYSFYGFPRIYDEGLAGRLRAALEALLLREDSPDFLFYDAVEVIPYLSLCLRTVLELKKECSDKAITLSVVPNTETRALSSCWYRDGVLLAGRVLEPPPPSDRLAANDDFFSFRHRVRERWTIEQSDGLLVYAYPELYGPENKTIRSLQKKGKKELILLSDPDTAAYILSCYDQLCETEYIVMTGILAGRPYRAIGEELGIGAERVRQLAEKASRQIKKLLLARMKAQQASGSRF